MSYFIFKDIDSREFGILESLPLDIRAERATQVINMPVGVPIIYESDSYKAQTVTLSFGLRDNSVQNIMNINKWLCGRGKLIFSDDLGKYYDAVCNMPIIGERMIRHMGKIPIQFTVMPFRYELREIWYPMSITSSWTSNIHNDCPNTVLPTLKIYSDAGYVDFNYPPAGTIRITGVDKYVVVDIPKRRVFDKDGNVILNRTTGSLLKVELQPGDNKFYWDAGTKQVSYMLNRRWL